MKTKTIEEVLEEYVAENAEQIESFRKAYRELRRYHLMAKCTVRGCDTQATHMHIWVKSMRVAFYCDDHQDEFCIPILANQTAVPQEAS